MTLRYQMCSKQGRSKFSYDPGEKILDVQGSYLPFLYNVCRVYIDLMGTHDYSVQHL